MERANDVKRWGRIAQQLATEKTERMRQRPEFTPHPSLYQRMSLAPVVQRIVEAMGVNRLHETFRHETRFIGLGR